MASAVAGDETGDDDAAADASGVASADDDDDGDGALIGLMAAKWSVSVYLLLN